MTSTNRARTLGELSEVITKGTTPTTLGFDYVPQGIPFVRATNLGETFVDYQTDVLHIDQATDQALQRSRIVPGDVLLAIAGTIGRSSVVPKHSPLLNCNQAVCIIRPSAEIDCFYLKHWLESRGAASQIKTSTVTGVISNLSLSQVRSLRIPLPPLPEQRRIAAILDKADALRAKRREAFAKLDQLVQSVFLDMFGDPVTNPMGWPRVTLGMLTTKIGSGATPKGGDESYKETGISLIRSLNVHDGEFRWAKLAFIDEQQASKLRNVIVEDDDVLLNITGASVARVCRAQKTVLPARVNQHVSIIRCGPTLSSLYLEHALMSRSMKTKLLGTAESGATRQALTKVDIEQLEVPLPPLTLQRQFVAVMRRVQDQVEMSERSLKTFDAMFSSAQHTAFSGSL